ncbi:translation machinery-associated protein 16 isoform X1 [Oncorhynchus mykiss]|uniref:Translation machinery-associated protein 16 n=1 Tax=Oncorhynchus mykiss TaxID=8022 RepID=A0A8K9V8J8_ONCMY|nr:translation machinery-associated protein 16 isoform X1 [Oncorhynchus mykiss]
MGHRGRATDMRRKRLVDGLQRHLCFVYTEPKAGKGKPTQKEKVCHPYSRKAAYLASQEIRLGKKERQKSEKATRLNSIGDKLQWFQSQLDSEKTEFTKQDACHIIERYLQRFDGELDQIELVNGIKGRQGRLHGSRETVIKQTVERETALYHGNGFEIPDIINSKHLKTFREWSGDLKKLPNIKMRKFSSRGTDRTGGGEEEEGTAGGEEEEGTAGGEEEEETAAGEEEEETAAGEEEEETAGGEEEEALMKDSDSDAQEDAP